MQKLALRIGWLGMVTLKLKTLLYEVDFFEITRFYYVTNQIYGIIVHLFDDKTFVVRMNERWEW